MNDTRRMLPESIFLYISVAFIRVFISVSTSSPRHPRLSNLFFPVHRTQVANNVFFVGKEL